MALEYTNKLWKTLYIAYEVFAILLIIFPMCSVTYLFTRPRPTWSWTHAMHVAFRRHLGSVISKVDISTLLHIPDHRAIKPTTGYNAEGVWIEGVPSHFITSELLVFASVARVTPIRIPGYWYGRDGFPPKPTAPVLKSDKKRVFLYLHGGAYTVGSAHPGSLAPPYRNLVQLATDAPHLFAIEYRLSSTRLLSEKHPFPAALLDALAGYIHLVDVMGYDPSNIVVTGNSAGGNLALALVRYLVENQGHQRECIPSLPAPPGNLLLICPWTDLSNSHVETHMALIPPDEKLRLVGSANTNDMDLLGDSYAGGYPSYGVLAYVGPFGLGITLGNPYISPACLTSLVQARFMGFPRTFIVSGGAERFLDQIRTLRGRMTRDMGERHVTYYEERDGVHGFLSFPSHPGGRAALDAIGNWLAQY